MCVAEHITQAFHATNSVGLASIMPPELPTESLSCVVSPRPP